MSTKERRRLGLLERVKAGVLTLREASQSLELSYRQTRRVFARFKSKGDAGLVHGLRGKAGNRQVAKSQREQVVGLYREHYADFGCTLACEYLSSRHGLTVDDQTLRRWLTAAGLWQRRRKSTVKRRRRERRACFGEMVQLDGSHHDWFESRPCAAADGSMKPASVCVLMVMIDDATGWVHAQFFDGETTRAAMTMVRQWSLEHGLPAMLYPDQDSIYRVNTKAADEVKERTGVRPPTQFGQAMLDLGVKLTCAKSPQAKGRVERMNGTLQDRLVKALRLAVGGGISDMAAANVFLKETFLPQLNEKFSVSPADAADVHRPVSAAELDAALCVRQQRMVGKDQCVSLDGQVLQLQPQRGRPSLAGKSVTLRRSLEGALTVHWGEQVVPHRALAQRPAAEAVSVTLADRVASHTGPWRPPSHHPWKRGTPAGQAGTEQAGPATGRPPAEPGSAPASAAPPPALRQAQPAG